jgi:hypothetical protein
MTKALRDTTGVVLDGRELSVTVPIGEISEAVAGLIQAAITISSAVYHHRSAEASGFAAVVAKIIEQNAPREGLRIVRDWRDPVVDKSGAWPVDFRVDGESIDTEARNIFVVSNAAKLMRTAATTLFLKSHGERSVSAAIVDPHYRLTDRQTRRLQTSVDAIMFDVERRPQQLLKLLVA